MPDRLRRITVEEAAAIQSFPTGVRWAGSRSAQYRQIGNAVALGAFRGASPSRGGRLPGPVGRGDRAGEADRQEAYGRRLPGRA